MNTETGLSKAQGPGSSPALHFPHAHVAVLLAAVGLSGCGGGSGTTDAPSTTGRATAQATTSVPSEDKRELPSVKLIAKVSETVVDADVSDHVYRVQVTNGSRPLTRAVVRLTGAGDGTRVVKGFVHVGDLASWSKANPEGTVTIRHDRGFRMDRSALAWSVTSLDEPPAPELRDVPASPQTVSQADCSIEKLGTSVARRDILEPVSGVTLDPPLWVAAAGSNPAFCQVTGTIAPVDASASNIDIRFRVALPSTWAYRAVQVGGGGQNGSIPSVTGGGHLARGWVVLGSDSGHQVPDETWTLHDEALKNFGYMQLKKTHDAAWVLIERMYGRQPVYSYFVGNSQGGREGLTVAQRYAEDFDGVVATVPVVSLSNINLSRALIRIQERPLANWVTAAKRNAVSGEVVRRCDALDGLVDGVVNNYMACRQLFDVTRGDPHPWAAKRCPGNIDPNPADTSINACLTDGQISTLEFNTRRYHFSEPLAHGTTSFGMWGASIDLFANQMTVAERFRTQEGAPADAVGYAQSPSWSGSSTLAGGLFQDLNAEVLDYVEGGRLAQRRKLVSEWLDSTNPDLAHFFAKGGRLVVQSGAADSRASAGAQLDYYQSVLDRMGRGTVDRFARFYIAPQGGHGGSGSSFNVDGEGRSIPVSAIPGNIDHVQAMVDWKERALAPSMSPTMTGNTGTQVLCSYPTYPRYLGAGLPTNTAGSYACTE
jgi:hypothetical protein